MDINKLVKEMIDCAYKVRMELAPGYLESVYKNAMLVELKLRGLKYETEKLIKVNYKGFVVGDGYGWHPFKFSASGIREKSGCYR